MIYALVILFIRDLENTKALKRVKKSPIILRTGGI